MYKIKTNLFYALCLLVGIGAFTACSDDKTDPSTNPKGNISGVTDQKLTDIQVVDSGSISWHDHYTGMLKQAQQANGEEDSLLVAYATRQLEEVDSLEAAYKNSFGAKGQQSGVTRGWGGKDSFFGYKYVVLKYKTIDKDGKPIECSELVAAPYRYHYYFYERIRPHNLIIGCHATITSDAQCPSNNQSSLTDVGMLISHARMNLQTGVNQNLVIIPDYQGYGATRKDAHPYLSQDLTARQVLDGVIAGKMWYDKWGGIPDAALEEGFKTLVVGYSQGGSVAMAVQRYIEKNNLSETLNFAGSICGNGPYDPVATLKAYIADDKIYMPVAAALIIKGMCDAAPGVAGQYSPSDYLAEGFLKSGILDWISSKDYKGDEIQEKLLAYALSNDNGFVMMRKDDTSNEFLPYITSNQQTADGKKRKWASVPLGASCYCTVSQVLRPEVIEYFKNGSVETQYMAKMIAIQDALEKNNLTQGWLPQHPIFVFHSEADEVVPFVNYQNAELAFSQTGYFRGIILKDSSATHKNSGSMFYLVKEGSYFKSILSNTWKQDFPNNSKYE